MIKAASWLFFIMMFLAGCGPGKVAVSPQALPCPRPPWPIMRALDQAEGVCSRKNETAKAGNASALRAYAEGLEATVVCYEKQTGGRPPE